MAFCASLRKRTPFSSAVTKLATVLSLKENRLDTHDLSIKLPHAALADVTGVRATPRLLVLLFSEHDVADDAAEATIDRVQRFAALNAGINQRIVFLLSLLSATVTDAPTTDGPSAPRGIYAYSKLQVLLHELDDLPYTPLLPCATLDQLPALLLSHAKVLAAPTGRVRQVKQTSAWTLLRQCTMRPPMEESMAYFVTDTFANIKELAIACSRYGSTSSELELLDSAGTTETESSPYFPSTSEQAIVGNARQVDILTLKLRKLFAFNREAARDIVTFWQAEWLMD